MEGEIKSIFDIGNLVYHDVTTNFINFLNKKEYIKRIILRWKDKIVKKHYNPHFIFGPKNNRSCGYDLL